MLLHCPEARMHVLFMTKKGSTTTRTGRSGRGASSLVPNPCRFVAAPFSFFGFRRLLANLLCIVAASFSGPAPAIATDPAANTVKLDFEGIGDGNPVGDYYGGGGGGPAKDYGIVFGANAFGIVSDDVPGGSGLFSNAPSPSTALYLYGVETQLYVTFLEPTFAGLSFQYTSAQDVNITVYDGPNMTGTVVGTYVLPAAAPCYPKTCARFTVWESFTVPFSGGDVVARSAGFSANQGFYLFVDDVVMELAAPPTKSPSKAPTNPPTKAPSTKAPTKAPSTKPPTKAPSTKAPVMAPTTTTTKRPTRFPTRLPTAKVCRKGMKGSSNMRRCRMMK